MMNVANAAAERNGGPESRGAETVTHVDAVACASRLGISKRHWIRMVDAGKAPQPVKLGRLVRWSLNSLTSWEAAGCKPIRHAGRAG